MPFTKSDPPPSGPVAMDSWAERPLWIPKSLRASRPVPTESGEILAVNAPEESSPELEAWEEQIQRKRAGGDVA
jgi:hypothetical protein